MLRYAGFWVRAAASFVDSALVILVSQALAYLAIKVVGLASDSFRGNASFDQWISSGAQLFINLPYFIVGHAQYGTTFGKKLFGIRVQHAETGQNISLPQSTIRFVSTILSALPLGIGYMMAGWDDKKRALHDRLASTVCVKTK